MTDNFELDYTGKLLLKAVSDKLSKTSSDFSKDVHNFQDEKSDITISRFEKYIEESINDAELVRALFILLPLFSTQ